LAALALRIIGGEEEEKCEDFKESGKENGE
jgi:hypothetical protein